MAAGTPLTDADRAPWLRAVGQALADPPEGAVEVKTILVTSPSRGDGKTSLACATAVGLADRGKRVLLVSTDPASNLDEVLGVPLGSQPTAIPDVPGLFAMNLDADEAAREYRER
ncbi:MAG: hypothetical protein HGA44_20670, partial [Cellulomonadaceae bacterium]|nr:hypothetical protein [Cellulomonadaceae bacterium]